VDDEKRKDPEGDQGAKSAASGGRSGKKIRNGPNEPHGAGLFREDNNKQKEKRKEEIIGNCRRLWRRGTTAGAKLTDLLGHRGEKAYRWRGGVEGYSGILRI